MDDAVRNLVIGSIVLVLAALYGGQTLGSWFFIEGEMEVEDDYGETIEFTANFNLEGWEYEVTIEDNGYKEDYDGDPDYDDKECSFPDSSGSSDCDELYDLMQGQIQKLLYVVILAGGVALYFINDGDQEKGALACLAMGGAGLLAAVLFALNFPEALDDDTEAFEIVDEDPSLLGDNNDFLEDDGADTQVNWRPGFAFVLVALSGLLGMGAYAELKT
mgnify:CR=1 FL=1